MLTILSLIRQIVYVCKKTISTVRMKKKTKMQKKVKLSLKIKE